MICFTISLIFRGIVLYVSFGPTLLTLLVFVYLSWYDGYMFKRGLRPLSDVPVLDDDLYTDNCTKPGQVSSLTNLTFTVSVIGLTVEYIFEYLMQVVTGNRFIRLTMFFVSALLIGACAVINLVSYIFNFNLSFTRISSKS